MTSSVGAPRGHGFVTMHRGYVMVVFSNDGGGGGNSGGFAFLDVTDPENPVNVFTTEGTAPYNDPGSSQYAGRIREAQQDERHQLRREQFVIGKKVQKAAAFVLFFEMLRPGKFRRVRSRVLEVEFTRPTGSPRHLDGTAGALVRD